MPALYQTHTQDQQRKSIADAVPNGKLWKAKNTPGTNYYKLLFGMANSLVLIDEVFNTLAYEYNFLVTTLLIDEWEAALGIPDNAFSNKAALDQRRIQCLLKFGWSWTNNKDFVDAAALLGISPVIITNKFNLDNDQVYPLTYPFTYSSAEDPFIIIVDLPTSLVDDAYPLTYPFTYENGKNIIESLFIEACPAHCEMQFRYIL